jgi:hypothetical protein
MKSSSFSKRTINPVTPTTSFKTLSADFAFTEGDPGCELQAELGVRGVPHLGVSDAPSIAFRSGVLCMMMMIQYL